MGLRGWEGVQCCGCRVILVGKCCGCCGGLLGLARSASPSLFLRNAWWAWCLARGTRRALGLAGCWFSCGFSVLAPCTHLSCGVLEVLRRLCWLRELAQRHARNEGGLRLGVRCLGLATSSLAGLARSARPASSCSALQGQARASAARGVRVDTVEPMPFVCTGVQLYSPSPRVALQHSNCAHGPSHG